jgi:hypothetical protein
MDAADCWDPQRLQDLASAAEKEKASLIRKRVGDEKAGVSCRYGFFKVKFEIRCWNRVFVQVLRG